MKVRMKQKRQKIKKNEGLIDSLGLSVSGSQLPKAVNEF